MRAAAAQPARRTLQDAVRHFIALHSAGESRGDWTKQALAHLSADLFALTKSGPRVLSHRSRGVRSLDETGVRSLDETGLRFRLHSGLLDFGGFYQPKKRDRGI